MAVHTGDWNPTKPSAPGVPEQHNNQTHSYIPPTNGAPHRAPSRWGKAPDAEYYQPPSPMGTQVMYETLVSPTFAQPEPPVFHPEEEVEDPTPDDYPQPDPDGFITIRVPYSVFHRIVTETTLQEIRRGQEKAAAERAAAEAVEAYINPSIDFTRNNTQPKEAETMNTNTNTNEATVDATIEAAAETLRQTAEAAQTATAAVEPTEDKAKRKSSWRGAAKIVGGVLGGAALAVGGYVLYRKYGISVPTSTEA